MNTSNCCGAKILAPDECSACHEHCVAEITPRFASKQDEMDYWAIIETAAKDGTTPEHDCGNVGGELQGCETCEHYAESRAWWTDARNFMNHEN